MYRHVQNNCPASILPGKRPIDAQPIGPDRTSLTQLSSLYFVGPSNEAVASWSVISRCSKYGIFTVSNLYHKLPLTATRNKGGALMHPNCIGQVQVSLGNSKVSGKLIRNIKHKISTLNVKHRMLDVDINLCSITFIDIQNFRCSIGGRSQMTSAKYSAPYLTPLS